MKPVQSVSKLIMSVNTSYKGSGGLVIGNGIISRAVEPFVIEHNSYGEFVLERLRASPEFVGQVDGLTGKGESFSEMAEKSVKCAMWLKEQDIKPGDIIGTCTHSQMDMYVPCLASLYVGAVFNPWWNDGITSMMMKHFITMAEPKILFVDNVTAELALEVSKEMDVPMKIVVIGNLLGFLSLDDILASQDTNVVSEFRCVKLMSHDEPALILLTSGSSGLPKGALHSHKALFGSVDVFSEIGKIEDHATLMIFTPLAWATGIYGMLRAIVRRETRIVHPEFSERVAFQLIEKFKINWMLLGYSPTVRILNSPESSNYDLSSLKCLVSTGTALKKETHEALVSKFLHTTIIPVFGSTELGGVTIYEHPGDKTKCGSCGTVVRNILIKVIDIKSGVILGSNQTGEICFKSPNTMTGYYKNPKATEEAIDAEGWLHSGDLGYYDEEGSMFITDRIKELIIYRGRPISPAMIEQLLLTHSEVMEAAVVSVLHHVDGEHPIAFVVKKQNAQATKEDLDKLVTDNLPYFMQLRGGIEFLTEMPHTSTGKIRKGDLRKMARSRTSS